MLAATDVLVPAKSNCLFGALLIRRRLGGRLSWRPGWKRRGWRGFLGNPWGHWRVEMPDGSILSYSTLDKEMPVWNQLWFKGYLKTTVPN